MAHFLDGKSILVTGGTGTFGQAFVKRVIETTKASRVIIFSRDEWKQWKMQEEEVFRHPNIRFFLGDIRDLDRLKRAFQDVQYVVHAAALKQVPAAEYNPTEFIKTNVMGAMNISTAAIESGVEKVIALSSDKAVNPINLYGATKLCSDKLLVAANAYVGKRGYPTFSVVRYGNVLGSRGSLLPYWKSLLEKGEKELPLTDPLMTRFWMKIQEAIDFVLFSLEHMQGGELFIPKSPSFYIKDLAKALFPEIPLKVTGVRPGEKLHEVLISHDDARTTYEFSSHYRIVPEFHFQLRKGLEESLKSGKKVASDFVLSSDKNPRFISSLQEIKALTELV